LIEEFLSFSSRKMKKIRSGLIISITFPLVFRRETENNFVTTKNPGTCAAKHSTPRPNFLLRSFFNASIIITKKFRWLGKKLVASRRTKIPSRELHHQSLARQVLMAS
jgi:hypothetical protein